jgi:hypothetical protein
MDDGVHLRERFDERVRRFSEASEGDIARYIIDNRSRNPKTRLHVRIYDQDVCHIAFGFIAGCGRDRVSSVLRDLHNGGREHALARCVGPLQKRPPTLRSAIRRVTEAWVVNVGYVSTRTDTVYLPGLSPTEIFHEVKGVFGDAPPSISYFKFVVTSAKLMGGLDIVFGDKHEHKRCGAQ